ncbi:cysteine--tRNA ligase [Ornithinimicrobium cryptoxanthini]|uniref:Cysteine--tRNA ligase n=1 Tax=Ornithinimicrobium cryptoxanthini TaxID=2934161 RepID=A0ABY4YJB3_9MICO|nr:cysteine--tRNA ligase [Ornithinimicrobium cryptoxanthini]USQ76873.1 cysteine--tRNA ligase [Ornithinimicrobium cryptoxanthini]
MSLHLFDTATRELRAFEPLEPGRVGIYICGLTTQGTPHIGHVRFAVAFDILRRWLVRGHGFDVTLVRNVTDIDDKILHKSAEHDRPWWAWSYLHERETTRALETLGVLAPTYEPRATGHITEMIELIDALVERGHAYPAADDSGDVYFDVRSWPAYGELTHQKIEDMEPAADADPRGKRDPRDFALWKGAKEHEPATASWPTAYGRGRPGWHLECSAMARKYLGDTFDIHGGGVDLRFPHHENEQAQSRAAGLGFARYWLHNAWLTLSGEKMSKSLGNTLTVSELTKQVRPLVLRYYIGSAHYRSTIEYGERSLEEAQAAVERIEGYLQRALEALGEPADGLAAEAATLAVPREFAAALDDDLNVPEALAVLFGAVREGNRALDQADGTDRAAVRTNLLELVAMTDVLGINPLDPVWGASGASGTADSVLDDLVQQQLAARAAARAERDFATADAIRDQLAAVGVVIEDTPAGARWALARETRTEADHDGG